MYKVETCEIKSGVFGAKMAKMDQQLADIMNRYEADGWVFVSMTELGSDSKNFTFKLVFRKA